MSRFLPQLHAALLIGLFTVVIVALTGAASAETGEAGDVVVAEAAAPADTAALTIRVSGLAEVSGHLFIALYDSEDTWLGDETVLLSKVVIDDHREGELVEVPLDVPAGKYAMTVFYDEDDNGELNTNFIGMPKEPIALSNNATGKFGPPRYEDAVFEIGTEPVVQAINMAEL